MRSVDEVVASLGELEKQFLNMRWPFGRHERQTYRTPSFSWARDANASLIARGLVEQWVHAKTGERTYRLTESGVDVIRAIHELNEANVALAPAIWW